MAINFSGLPFAAYQGDIVSKPFQRLNRKGTIVGATIDWSQYASGLLSVGDPAVPAFVVIVNYEASGKVPQPFTAVSIYVDNLASITPLYVYWPDTGYSITVPEDAEGWFPVVSNANTFWIIGMQFQQAFLPLTRLAVTDLFVTPYTNVSLPQAASLQLASPVIGLTGAGLASVTAINPGLWYTPNASGVNAALSVTGGGGSGATVQTTLERYGRFTNPITVTAVGANYLTAPVITATGPNNVVPPAFNSGFSYPTGGNAAGVAATQANGYASQGNKVYYWKCTNGSTTGQVQAAGAVAGPPLTVPFPTPFGGFGVTMGWVDTGLSATPVAATFQAALQNVQFPSQIVTTGFGVPALGDQGDANFLTFTGATVPTGGDNLFGTPAASGLILITGVYIAMVTVGTAASTFALQTAAGATQFILRAPISLNVPALLNLQNCNVALDATQQWQFKCTTFGTGNFTIQYAFTWSYSQSI